MPVVSSSVDTPILLAQLGRGSNDPELLAFVVAHRIHDRPKTVQQLQDEDAIEDDGETDVEYELAQASQDSMLVQSERYGFCFKFKTWAEYSLVHTELPAQPADFVLEEIGLFAKGVQIYQAYSGALPGGLRFGMTRQDPGYTALGKPLARRDIYDTSTDLFVLNGHIVNCSFDDSSPAQLIIVHVRQPHEFDRVMLSAQEAALAHTLGELPLGTAQLGALVASSPVQQLFAKLGIDEVDLYDGVCPEEIERLAQPEGITLYFRDLPRKGQALGAITYKRRGDLGSHGYTGPLPWQLAFGDSPETVLRKAQGKPVREHRSDQLLSYYWRTPSGLIVQALCSLIDWQLYRVTCFAPFMDDEILS